MRPKTMTAPLLCLLLLTCLACAPGDSGARTTPTPAPPAPQATPQSAACRMLSAEDVREVQGEAPQETQGNERVAGGLTMSQCFFRLPTFSKSVNVEVLRPAPGSSPEAVAEFWRERFHPSAEEERERGREEEEERERERKRAPKREGGREKEAGRGEKGREEGEKESKPLRVAGVGDEAYWSGNQITAALSVLTKGAVLRVSVGGPEPQDEKIKKAKTLALKLLGRL